MSETSRQIQKSIEGLGEAPHVAALFRALQVVRLTPLREKHFETVKSSMRTLKNTMPHVMFYSEADSADRKQGAPPNQRLYASTLVSLSTLTTDRNVLVPMSIQVLATQKATSFITRSFPITVASSHTEFRHVQRTTEKLQYAQEDFQWATMFSIPLCRALDRHLPEIGNLMRIGIPHSKGIFLAEASRQVFSPTTHANIYPRQKQQTFLQMSQRESFSVPVLAHVWSSLTFRDFKDEQWELYEAMRPFREDQAVNAALLQGIHLYTTGPFYPDLVLPKQREAWDDVYARIEDLVASRPWKNGMDQPSKPMPLTSAL